MQGLLPTPGAQVNPLALVNNLVGALMGQPQQSMGFEPGMSFPRDDRRRGRSRSPMRRGGRVRSRSRDRRRRRSRSPARRKRSPPAERAEHEIYVGNYPAGYTENDLKNLFSEFLVDVGKIRMKHDGRKVFAFAETTSMDMVQKAIKAMDGKEINGRRLRVRGSKDCDKKFKAQEKKKERIPTVKDSKKHLVTAFVAFINRELENSSQEENDDFKGLLEASRSALTAAYSLPADDTYAVNRDIEGIFFRAVRLDIKLPPEPESTAEEPEADPEAKAEERDAESAKAENEENDVEDMEAEPANEEKEKYDPETANDDIEDKEDVENAENKPDEEPTEGDEIDLDDDEKMMADIENVLAEDDEGLDVGNAEEKEPEKEKKVAATPSRGRSSRPRRGRM